MKQIVLLVPSLTAEIGTLVGVCKKPPSPPSTGVAELLGGVVDRQRAVRAVVRLVVNADQRIAELEPSLIEV